MKNISISEMRNGIGLFVLKSLISFAVSYLFAEAVSASDNALNVIVNTFSILSGFLFLIITMSSALSAPVKSFNLVEQHNQNTRFNQRFIKTTCLFLGYLFVLLLIFIFFTIKNNIGNEVIKSTLYHSIVFFACFAFLSSLQLPWIMKKLSLEDYIQKSHK